MTSSIFRLTRLPRDYWARFPTPKLISPRKQITTLVPQMIHDHQNQFDFRVDGAKRNP